MMKNIKMMLLAGALLFVGQAVPVMASAPSEVAAEECSICTDPLDGPEVVSHMVNTDGKMGCRNQFHKACIVAWLEKNLSCPFCRALGMVDAKCFVPCADTGHGMGLAPHADLAIGGAGGGHNPELDEMSEEDMLQLAMAESLRESQELEAAMAASRAPGQRLRYYSSSDEEDYAGAGQGIGLPAARHGYAAYPDRLAGWHAPLPLPLAPTVVDENAELEARIKASVDMENMLRGSFSGLTSAEQVHSFAKDMAEDFAENPDYLNMLGNIKNNRLREISQTYRARTGAGVGTGTGAGGAGARSGVMNDFTHPMYYNHHQPAYFHQFFFSMTDPKEVIDTRNQVKERLIKESYKNPEERELYRKDFEYLENAFNAQMAKIASGSF